MTHEWNVVVTCEVLFALVRQKVSHGSITTVTNLYILLHWSKVSLLGRKGSSPNWFPSRKKQAGYGFHSSSRKTSVTNIY
jgi:hypothetical protein